jgi:hypothetical protein
VRDVRFWWKRYGGYVTMVTLDCDSVDWLADASFSFVWFRGLMGSTLTAFCYWFSVVRLD